MTMPSWHDPVATARREAELPLSRGLTPRPTLIAFEGDEPTLYVRSRLAWDPDEQTMLMRELVALPVELGPSRLLVVSPGRMSDPDLDDPVLRDVSFEAVITVDAVERDDTGRIRRSGHLLPYTIGDAGEPSWQAPTELPEGGPWAPILEQVLTGAHGLDDESRVGAVGVAYALSRWGVVVAVAPAWRSRYGFDEPFSPRRVRSEDQRRARVHVRRARQDTSAGSGR